MTNECEKPKFDLEERTAKFAEAAIEFAMSLRRTSVTSPIITQFIRSATSIGANYCEADDAESKRDFRHKIALCRKEARETKYWLRLIVKAMPKAREQAANLWQESKELHLIFSAILRNAKKE